MRRKTVFAAIAILSLAACTNAPQVSQETSTTEPPAPTTTTTTLLPPDGKTSDERTLSVAFRVSNDNLQPKSIVHSGNGLFFAQNMMYRHNVSVFNREGKVVATIDDKVDLAAFGISTVKMRSSIVKGSPVEAAFSPDSEFAYVSNYKMYGGGWNPITDDSCQGRNWDPSYVYRISTTSFVIDQVIEVGAVPKFLAVSPDNKFVVVSNFCSQDVSIIDIARGLEVQRVLVGSHPRGIAITNDSSTAYVSVMGGGNVIAINLKDFTTRTLSSAGYTPRHLVLSPDNSVLYITNNKSGTVRAINPQTDTVIATVRTGTEPRTMVMSEDGASLYVVNYQDDQLSKIRTSDMKVIQTIATGDRPIGVTYDAEMRQVWVANYSGSLFVYEDR
jgi:YVTN family beta-propeller protein